ncbi:MAG: hypothetical protein K0R59_469 [Sphingobacterium sp.]|jgi:hypothetical protein|nr:hypothetical protein [Sphingobacterium sp.]
MIKLSILLSKIKVNFNHGKLHLADGRKNYLQMKGDAK